MSYATGGNKPEKPGTPSFYNQPPRQDPLLGREIKDYRLLEKLGGGAFGAVYRAEHTRLPKSFALKVLHPHIAGDDTFTERFRLEANSLASLNHPNVVQIMDFDWADGIGFYLVLEWLDGEPLNKFLRREKRLPPKEAFEIASQLLDALGYAHSQGIVHRDLKPANLMLLPLKQRRILKILDFGVAKILEDCRSPSLQDDIRDLTSPGTAIGSASYMSPEQAKGQLEQIDARSDLYSCGIILAEILTGSKIFRASSEAELYIKQITEAPPTLHQLYPEGDFSLPLENIIAQALAKDPTQRFQTADEFLQKLQQALFPDRAPPKNIAQLSKEDLLNEDFEEEDLLDSTIIEEQLPPGLRPQTSPPSAPDQPTTPDLEPFQQRLASELGLLPSAEDQTSPEVAAIGSPEQDVNDSTIEFLNQLRQKRRKVLLLFSLLAVFLFTGGVLLWQRVSSSPPPSPPPTSRPASSRRPAPVVPASASITLLLQSKPPGAAVFANGEPQGKTPLRLQTLPQQPLQIRLEKPGFVTKQFTWQADKDEKRLLYLAPSLWGAPSAHTPRFSLRLLSKPSGATVFVDGKNRGKTPLTLRARKGQKLQIRLKKKGFIHKYFTWKATKNEKRLLHLAPSLW